MYVWIHACITYRTFIVNMDLGYMLLFNYLALLGNKDEGLTDLVKLSEILVCAQLVG